MVYDKKFIEECDDILQLANVKRYIDSSIELKQYVLDNAGMCDVLACELDYLKEIRKEVLHKIADILINKGNVTFSVH